MDCYYELIMLHRIINSKVITTPFIRFETNSGEALDPVFTTGGTATFQWISPDGSISTGAVPNPILDQIGQYTVKCSDWTDVTGLVCNDDNITVMDNLHILAPTLTGLGCYDNYLTVLDVTNLILLTVLSCDNNYLTVLDVMNLTLLTTLRCQGNNIANLEVIALTALVDIQCQNNGMNEVAVDNILADLVTAGAINGSAQLGGTNAAPSEIGLANKAILVARGWIIVTS